MTLEWTCWSGSNEMLACYLLPLGWVALSTVHAMSIPGSGIIGNQESSHIKVCTVVQLKFLYPLGQWLVVNLSVILQRVPRMTHSSFSGLDKNLLAGASSALRGIRLSTQPVCLAYYAYCSYLFFFGYRCTCNWKPSSVLFVFWSCKIIHKSVSCSHFQ
jgi:hypothetical protein